MPKVLIADDSLSVRKVAERLLTSVGLDVSLVANGEEAMTWLSKGQPDLVIVDVIMPGKTGYDVCKFVKSNAALAGTPVLLIAGVVDAEVNRQAQACRADDILKKPFKGSSLQDRVMELLAARQGQPAISPVQTSVSPTSSQSTAAAVTDLEAKVAEERGRVAQLEAQGQALRRAAYDAEARVKALETQLTEEHKRTAELEDQLQEIRENSSQSSSRTKELYAQLAEEQKRAAQLEEQAQALREAADQAVSRARDLETNLTQERRRTAQLEEQVQTLGLKTQAADRATVLEGQLEEERRRAAQVEEQLKIYRENANQASARVKELEVRLVEEEKRTSLLKQQVAGMEEAAACAEKLGQVLNEIARLAGKSGRA